MTYDGGMKGDSVRGVSVDDAALIARESVSKGVREKPGTFIQFATVVSVSTAEGSITYATVHMDGDPMTVTVTVAVLNGAAIGGGDRVAVIFDPPHGAYVMGSTGQASVPVARAGFCYGGGEQ